MQVWQSLNVHLQEMDHPKAKNLTIPRYNTLHYLMDKKTLDILEKKK